MKYPAEKEIEKAMEMAIRLAMAGKTAFGAVLINFKGDVVISSANTGKKDGPLAHAEMNLLRKATKRKLELNELFLVTTCEPCPMCMGAAIWSGIEGIYYGLDIESLSKYRKQIKIDSEAIAAKSFYQPKIEGGILKEKVLKLITTVNSAKS